MTSTLNAPVYEINKKSDFYKRMLKKKESLKRVNEIVRLIEKDFGFKEEEFVYYGSNSFGFYSNAESYEKYKASLTKNSDRNGVHRFKKTSKEFKHIKEKMLEVDLINQLVSPFEPHEIFGFNNIKASQWIGDRLFYGLKNSEVTEKAMINGNRRREYEIEPAVPLDYKEYLKITLEWMEEI